MKNLLVIVVTGVFTVFAFSNCSSEEPSYPVETGIGLSTHMIKLDYDDFDDVLVTVKTDNWVLSHVNFSDTMSYVCDLSSSLSTFSFTKEWIKMNYENGEIHVSAINPNFTSFDECDFRQVDFIFTYGSCTDTLTCMQEPVPWIGGDDIQSTPAAIEFSAAGGTSTVTTKNYAWWFSTLALDNQNYDYPDFIEQLPSRPFPPFNHTFEWFSVDRYDDYSFNVTVTPNTTGIDRKFKLVISSNFSQNVITGIQYSN